MLRLSLSTFRDRWELFIGAILSVAVGVALVQASMLVLTATGKPRIPPGLSRQDEDKMREGFVGAATVMGMTAFLAMFLAVFIVSSTFAYTVAQRRRELALLRMVGGSRQQLRVLLLSESLLLGLIGAALGVPLGVVAKYAQTWLLIEIGLLPNGFTADWQPWAVVVAGVMGVGVALAGVFAASLRAAKIRPLEALRETGAASTVMTESRWLIGLAFAACTVAMVVWAQGADLIGAMMAALGISMFGAVAMSMLSPLVVPFMAWLFGIVLRGSPLAGLAQANLRDGVRRSAATAAPLIVLVSLLLGLTGTFASLAAAGGEEAKRSVNAQLVVTSTGTGADRIAKIDGVAVASIQTTVDIVVTMAEKNVHSGIVAVDPNTYARTHNLPPGVDLSGLTGNTIVTGPARHADRIPVGTVMAVDVAGQPLSLTVVSRMPETLETGDSFLIPRQTLPTAVLEKGTTETVVQVAEGYDPAVVARRIEDAGFDRVQTVSDWATTRAENAQDGNVKILTVLMGLAGLYALMAVINSVVVAGAERRREFAVARVTGLTRPQVVAAAVIESVAVAIIGLALGCLVAGAGLVGIGGATNKAVGTAVVSVPWTLLALVTLGSVFVVALTSGITAVMATREQPVSLATIRE
ncbi:ABC transporter permease [Kibdelosporangium aridum]|uniref:ABC transporter permease n=1 Tax=Kibdelosporangium aridum TaxID=2030 RepID=A0A428ZUA0_KIBAR|nr:FtsX-like permease family protein [Kibdelosporangium aridum]RSM91543.1 ABC transporter permease [Kibdelosporangium aridum]